MALGLGASMLACDEEAELYDARYPPRPTDCAVRLYAHKPDVPVDELGTAGILCPSCRQQLVAEICRRGGDIAWGLEDAWAASRGGARRGGPGIPLQIQIAHTRVAEDAPR